jgi:EAL domain-containing protein (putative c-di-GMP-specific phosphodiesterase class I)/DNA-binding NarL/FixJ family response regulator
MNQETRMASLRFLVAEDHDFQRATLVKMLARLGARTVHEAADGGAALNILQDPVRPVDIVISDLEMPGMDGMEFVRHLAETGAPISIILASALESKLLDSVATMSHVYGINLLGVVEKPITPAKLLPLIESYRPAQPMPSRPVASTFTQEEIVTGLRDDEFEPFFQPKIDLVTGKVRGAEALARWRHPKVGIVAPYAFIKPLEDDGMINDLTWIMLSKAAAFCRTWRATGVDVTVSVNLSVKSLNDVDIADRVTQLVLEQNVEARHIVLEVTESAAATQVGKALEGLARLRMKGFGLSIDDYGTGYSSMQQLTRIAFTELKIDQSFVMNAAKQDSSRVILESGLEMARKLNIASVAEGVETQADFDLLCGLRCDMAQGYFIARPLDGTAYLSWARDWREREAVPEH